MAGWRKTSFHGWRNFTRLNSKEYQVLSENMGYRKATDIMHFDFNLERWNFQGNWGHRTNTRDRKLNRHKRIKPPWRK